MTQTRIILLGTGSSGGVPRPTGEWGDCTPDDPRNARLRCGAVVQQRQNGEPWHPDTTTTMLIDLPPDLRAQLLHHRVQRIDGVALTHAHADQLHGIDDLRAHFHRQGRIALWMDGPTRERVQSGFAYTFEGAGGYQPIYRPMAELCDGDAFHVEGPGGAIRCEPIQVRHGRINCLAFRIGALVYLNDVSAVTEAALARMKGAEVLIVDALRYTRHPTHAHLELALDWALQIGAAKVWLTNLHIDMDHAALASRLPAHVSPAVDGVTVII